MDQITHTVRQTMWQDILLQCQNRPCGMSAKQWMIENIDQRRNYPMHKKSSKSILFLALLLSLTTIIGCNSKTDEGTAGSTEPTQSQETESGYEISNNEVSSNTVSSNEGTPNTVSENVNEEKGPVFTKSLTDEEIDEISKPVFEYLTNNPPTDGIYNPDYDFSKSDSIYKNDRNYQREYYKALTFAYGAAACNKSIEENRIYTAIVCKKGFPIYAAEDTLSILTLNNDPDTYFIIKDYQGEKVILKDQYLDFCTGSKLEEDITDFNSTPMKDYNDKYYDENFSGTEKRKPGGFILLEQEDFGISKYKTQARSNNYDESKMP